MSDKGLEVIRLDEVAASEDTLCAAIKDCTGYILGGIETVTDRVINAAPKLKAISFTGANYAHFIPAHEYATRKGIAITNCPRANANAVAEYTLALLLPMVRQIPQLSAPDGKSFYIAPAFADLTVGIIGFGAIGCLVAEKLKALGFKVIVNTRTAQAKVKAAGFECLDLPALVQRSDIVTLHVDKLHGNKLLNADLIAQLKIGAIVINTCFPEALDQSALITRIKAGKLTAAADDRVEATTNLPVGHYVTTPHAAYNTAAANKAASDMATQSIINVLSGRDDGYIVNPDFKEHMNQ